MNLSLPFLSFLIWGEPTVSDSPTSKSTGGDKTFGFKVFGGVKAGLKISGIVEAVQGKQCYETSRIFYSIMPIIQASTRHLLAIIN